MATIEPRNRTEWRVVCAQRPALNRTFKPEAAARKYATRIEKQGLAGVRVNAHQTNVWVARVRMVGAPDISKTFDRQADAIAWSQQKEGEIAKRQFIDHRAADSTTLGGLLQQYDETKLGDRGPDDPDRCRIRKLQRHPMMQVRLSALTSGQIATYRDERIQEVKGTTVKKELELMSRVINLAGREWDIHLPKNPASGVFVSRPKPEAGDERDRRLRVRHSATPRVLEPAHQRKTRAARAAAEACTGIRRGRGGPGRSRLGLSFGCICLRPKSRRCCGHCGIHTGSSRSSLLRPTEN